MGFSSTFTTDMGYSRALPEWFVEKWKDSVHFHNGNHFPLSSTSFATVYRYWFLLELDIQRALVGEEFSHPDEVVDEVVLVYLHECGGLTRVRITKEHIEYHDPGSWRKADSNAAHDYGDSCLVDIASAQDKID